MRRVRSAGFVLFLVVGSFASRTLSTNNEQQEALVCKITVNEIEYQEDVIQSTIFNRRQEIEYICNPVQADGSVSMLEYTLELPIELEKVYRSRIVSTGEEVFVSIAGGTVSLDSVIIPDGAKVEIVEEELAAALIDYEHRRLRRPSSEGDLTALIIRISTLDAEPDESAARLAELSFGPEVSLKQQLFKCSFGKLRLSATKYVVLDVEINVTAAGNSRHVLVNEGSKAAASVLDVTDVRSVADFIMFILPPGTGKWGAYAATPGQLSVFNNKWGSYLGATAHELGHNLGLEHAYFDGEEYGDVSGYMGAAVKRHDYPLRCYNPQNHWKLGWYSDRTLEVDPNNPNVYHVAAFVDYRKAVDDEYVVLKVSNLDLYVQFNRAKDFNRDPGQYTDMLTIVKNNKYGTDLLGGLNSSHTLYEQTVGSQTLMIEVCEVTDGSLNNQPDLMRVSIGYDVSLCQASFSVLHPNNEEGPPSTSSSESPISAPRLRTAAPVETTSPRLNLSDIVMITLSCVCAVIIATVVILWYRRSAAHQQGK